MEKKLAESSRDIACFKEINANVTEALCRGELMTPLGLWMHKLEEAGSA